MSYSRFVRYTACEKCRERGKDSHGDNLALYSDGSAHCFSCKYHIPAKVFNLFSQKKEDVANKTRRLLPNDFSDNVPIQCLKWLMQFGLPYSYWRPKIGWSSIHERLIFRVGDPLLCSVGRLFPKEDSNRSRKWHAWGEPHEHVTPIGDGSIICLVEDLISAHKVSHAEVQSIPLFGTTIYPAHIMHIRQEGKPVILWLDKDQEDVAAKKAANITMLTGMPVSIVTTDKDPKNVELSKIRDVFSNISF